MADDFRPTAVAVDDSAVGTTRLKRTTVVFVGAIPGGGVLMAGRLRLRRWDGRGALANKGA